MKRSKFSEEQIAYVLRQVEGGTPEAGGCDRSRSRTGALRRKSRT